MKTEFILNSNGVVTSKDEMQLNGNRINGVLFGSHPVANQIDENNRFAFDSNLELLNEIWLSKYDTIKEVLNAQVSEIPKKFRYLPYTDLGVLILLRGQKIEPRDEAKAKELKLSVINLTDARCKVPFMFLEGIVNVFDENKPTELADVKSRTQLNYWVNAAKLSHKLDEDGITKLFDAGAKGISDLSECLTSIYNHKDNKDLSDEDKLKKSVEKMKIKHQKKNTKGNNNESNLVASIDGLVDDSKKLTDKGEKRSLDVKHRERELCLQFVEAFVSQSNSKAPLNVQLKTFKAWVEINTLND